jgi:hypothetical protein
VAWAKSKFEEYFSGQPQLMGELQAIFRRNMPPTDSAVETWLDALSDEQVQHFF